MKEGGVMAIVQTQIKIEEDVKKQATELFNQLGIDMSSAVNMFLKQAILCGGLPFHVEIPKFKQEVIEAMEEAKQISRNPNTKRYGSFAEALEDIDL